MACLHSRHHHCLRPVLETWRERLSVIVPIHGLIKPIASPTSIFFFFFSILVSTPPSVKTHLHVFLLPLRIAFCHPYRNQSSLLTLLGTTGLLL